MPGTIASRWSGRRLGRGTAIGGALAAAAVGLAACGSSTSGAASSGAGSGTTSSTGAGSGATSSTTAASGTPAAAAPSFKAASVAGFGSVLVDDKGRTIYVLSSEKGGKITCTDASGCTAIWPDNELPKGVTAAHAGTGIQASLLGSLKDAAGKLYVTYGGWPLYTYSGDSGPAQSNGEGITSFGGTWYVLGVSGNPVTSKSG